jgi:hypothetical protein
LERETLRVFPDRVYTTLRTGTGGVSKLVITPEFNYRNVGTQTIAVPTTELETFREQLLFDPIYIAQHAEDYAVSAPEGRGTTNTLRISRYGKYIIWEVDSRTGLLSSTRLSTASGDELEEISDWRSVDGVFMPFKRHRIVSGTTTDFAILQYELNPLVDANLFQRPAQNISQGLTFKVLQSQSVPYTQESGGGISTSCNIVGTANTSVFANTVGNSTFGSTTTNSDQHMSCNSYDTTMRWPHVLNVMFVQASDQNSYIIACDRAWRWSKCVPLRAGDVFNARFSEKGIEVQSFNTKGKEENPTYHILQSKSPR